MKQIHDIFVRAYVVPSEQEKDKQQKRNTTNGGKWPEYVLSSTPRPALPQTSL